jgi:RHS repeat-associated protein
MATDMRGAFQSGSSTCQNSAAATTYGVSYNNRNQIVQTPSSTPTYDDAGDISSDDTNHYLYDDEGRVCAVMSPPLSPGGSVGMTEYIYDAEGRRVGKGFIKTWSCDTTTNGFSLTNSYVLGLGGEQVIETDGSGQWLHTNVFVGGSLLATYDSDGVHFHIDDWLGTRRVQTDYLGRVESTYQNLPFGELVPQNNTMFLGATEHHFTGKERDTESGNDYFGARYYASSMGRFMTPDPSGLYYADPENPQSLNLYSYVLNNPLINVDPDGLECVWDDGSFDSKDDKQTGSSGGCKGQGGTWVDPKAFSTLNAGDWSNKANSNIAGIAQDLNSSSTTVTVTAKDPGIDPDEARINALVQGVAADTKDFTNLMNDTAYCVADNYGLTLATGATALAGAPVAKSALGVGNGLGGSASPYTSGLGAAAFKAFGANEPKFTGALGSLSKGLTGTARMAGAAGRVAQKAAPWMAVVNAASIVHCVAKNAK